MSSSYEPWRTQYSIDKEQRERIESLSHETQRLHSQLAKTQGNMESRLSALARAFDAFVELSDVRAELALYGDAAVARHRVRSYLTDALAGRPATLAVEDVPGYWLVPAVRALHAQSTGDQATAARYTTDATELDAPRSTLFLAAAATLLGLPGITAVQLAALLPAADPAEPAVLPVTNAQRAIWLAAADGQFGAAGRALLHERLAALLSTPETADAERNAWRTAVVRLAGAENKGLSMQRRAAAALAALRMHCTAALAPATPSDVDSEATATGADAPLADVVRSLVNEGFAAEIPLLRRAEELRRVVESGTAQPAPYESWDATAGTLHELARADIGPDTPPARRGVALRAARRWLMATADDFARDAAVTPPRTLTARSPHGTVTVGPNGADPGQYTAAERRIATSYQTSPRTRLVAGGLGAVAVVVTVVGFATALPTLAVIAMIGVVVDATVFYRQVRIAAEYTEAAASARAALKRDVDKARQQLEADRESTTTASRQARADHEQLNTLLA